MTIPQYKKPPYEGEFKGIAAQMAAGLGTFCLVGIFLTYAAQAKLRNKNPHQIAWKTILMVTGFSLLGIGDGVVEMGRSLYRKMDGPR